jgi:starvation-inducible outer membrane lipoprotein
MKHPRVWSAVAALAVLVITGALIDADALQAPPAQPTPKVQATPRAQPSPKASPAAVFFRVSGRVTQTAQGSFILEVTSVEKGGGITSGARLTISTRRRTRFVRGGETLRDLTLQRGQVVTVSGKIAQGGQTRTYVASVVRLVTK